MTRELLQKLLSDLPEDWIFLEDTNHAFQYAAEIYKDSAKFMHLVSQSKYFKEEYKIRLEDPNHVLDDLAAIAFQLQFQHECFQEIHKLVENMPPSIFNANTV